MPDTSGSELEIVRPGHPRGAFRFVLFDFDGTLSLIREGWQQVMTAMMVELLTACPVREADDELTAQVRELIARTTGKETIYQMMDFREEIIRRGGEPLEPRAYKQMYLDRLWDRIAYRVEGLKDGRFDPRTFTVPGSVALLQGLRARGCTLLLASGTDEAFVKDECAALGLSAYFDGGIFGAQEDLRAFSKKMLIERILREHGLGGAALLTFGDGFVEIEHTHEAGGVAVGVATDEASCAGIDAWKRTRLIQAGADVIIPHYRQVDALLAYLFAEGETA